MPRRVRIKLSGNETQQNNLESAPLINHLHSHLLFLIKFKQHIKHTAQQVSQTLQLSFTHDQKEATNRTILPTTKNKKRTN
jgi:hypothetical protein